MKQPKIRITLTDSHLNVIRNVRSIHFDNDGEIFAFSTDFFEDDNSNDFIFFQKRNNEFISIENETLKAEIL
jgi:hypothetical protein